MRAFSAAFFRENDTENGHKEELTYEENKTWISCFGNDRVSCCLDVLCRQCLKLQYTIQRDLSDGRGQKKNVVQQPIPIF